MAPCERGIGVRPPSRVPPSYFEGAARQPYESGRYSVTGLTPAMPHSGGDGLTGGVGGTASGHDSQAASGAWRGFVFDLGACKCQCIKCPCRGSKYGCGEPTRLEGVSSPRARQILTQGGRPALERGGTSPEETSGPRARRNLARGGVQPPSEADPHPRGATGPRARRNLT
jgi:hypothetical protein